MPRLGLILEALSPGRGAGVWRATWRIRDLGKRPLTVRQAWHPHPRFRGRRRGLALRVAAGASAAIELPVRTDVAPGEIVENAFLILQVTSARRRWRALARLRLRGTDGRPRVTVEAVDVHPAEG